MIARQHAAYLPLMIAALATGLAHAAEPEKRTVLVELHVVQRTVDAGQQAERQGPTPARVAEPTLLASDPTGVSVYVADANQKFRLAGHDWAPQTRCPAAVSATGAKLSDADGAYRIVTAPRLLCKVGEEASITIGQSVPYMVQRDDGSLVVKQFDETEGIAFHVLIDGADAEIVSFQRLRLRISDVVGRQPIPDVPFDVGRPMIRTMEASTALRLGADQLAIFALPNSAPDADPIYVFLAAEPSGQD